MLALMAAGSRSYEFGGVAPPHSSAEVRGNHRQRNGRCHSIGDIAFEGQKMNQPNWVTSPALRKPLYLPPEGLRAARIVAIIRALWLEDELPDARREYQSLVAQTRLVTEGKTPYPLPVIEDLPDGYAEQVRDYREAYLRSSEIGMSVLGVLLTLDAVGVDPLEVDKFRVDHNAAWQTAYGQEPTDRASRRVLREQRKALKSALKHLLWEWINDDTLMEHAQMWVKGYCVHKNVSTAVKLVYGDNADQFILESWYRKLSPFNQALGVRAKN
jgi:hypothetical protein